MTHDACDLDLMHRVYEGAGGAGLAQDVANIGDLGDRGTFAAQRVRDLDAEQPLFAKFLESLAWEARLGIDRCGIGTRDVAGRAGACRQGALPNAGNTRTG